MNPHEQAFVEAFINSERRERFLAVLADPRRRDIFHRQLHHPKANFLLTQYAEPIVPSQHYTQFLVPKLRPLGAPHQCWVFGNYIDGQEMQLERALDELIGQRSGTIISCLPGKLALLESEDGRVILRKS